MDTKNYKSAFLTFLSKEVQKNSTLQSPKNLYQPIHYILQLGGKRIRPILTLMSCELFGGKVEDALPAALSIEMFHNFTLIHDDIMDKADLRRGKKTVHKKWDENIAILSGDALMILAAQQLEYYDNSLFKKLSILFNKTALQVCEGQQYDIDFETENNVSLQEYLHMISYKTAVLLACALQMGAFIAGASDKDAKRIYEFGLFLGLAFQLQDDYLDTYGTEEFGKKIGGDIVENKKTFLFLKALEVSTEKDKEQLLSLYNKVENNQDKLELVKSIFDKYDVSSITATEIKKYTQQAFDKVNELDIQDTQKEAFINFGKQIMLRKS